MGSPVPRERYITTSASLSAGPEALARLVLRCRELSAFLESALPQLPARDETPFLYGQLDDVLGRLQSGLRQLVAEDPGQGEKGSFLRRLAGKKPREEKRKSEPLYDLQGNAWTIPVTELVGFLSHSGKSGLLWVTSPLETFVLEFSRGDLVHATSSAPPAAFRLGEILLGEKLLAAEELAQVIDLAKAADDLLGSYLLRTGRLRHVDLQRALAIQVQELFHRLMDAENALYRFQEGAQLLRSQSLEVNITHLLLESARKKDEERLKAERARAPAEEPAPAPAEAPAGKVTFPEPAAVKAAVAERAAAAKGALAKEALAKEGAAKEAGTREAHPQDVATRASALASVTKDSGKDETKEPPKVDPAKAELVRLDPEAIAEPAAALPQTEVPAPSGATGDAAGSTPGAS